MKKLLVLLLAAVVVVALYRRLSGSRGPATAGRTHQHGTPDHWPPVVRKPGAKRTSATAAA